MPASDAVAAIERKAAAELHRIPVRPPIDPGFAALRRAARGAIVIPLAFAFGTFVLHAGQNVIFIIFGCFALLIISDFGGQRPARAAAYLGATAAAAILVAIGTVASSNAVLAAVATLVVGFVISFARVFGGYLAAAQTGLLLAFVVSVSVRAPVTAVPGRVGALVVAGLLSTLAAVALWPRFERIPLHKKAAVACRRLADLVDGLAPNGTIPDFEERSAAARGAEQDARRQYAATAKRPAGPSRRDRALIELLTEIPRIIDLLERPFQDPGASTTPCLGERDDLKASVVAALRASAEVLGGGVPPDIRSVEEARQAHRAALDRWAAAELRSGRPPSQVLDGLDIDHTLRVVSHLTIALGRNAAIVAGADQGQQATDLDLPDISAKRETASRIANTIRAHLDPSSTVLHGSLRVAIGLAVAVFIADSLSLQRGFWVVLGTLQVLRSNALGTGRTTLEALAGNIVGVAIGALVATVTGASPVLLGAALPFAIFIAAYASTAVGFAASQAAFSVLLIIMFNLITPSGWRVGLVRIGDVIIGAAISVGIGIVVWPYGPRRDLARAMSRLYRSVGQYLDHAFDQLLGLKPASALDPARRSAAAAYERAGEAFDAFVNEKTASPLAPQAAGFLLSAANHLMLAASVLERLAGLGYQASGCPSGADTVGGQAHIVIETLNDYADRLDLGSSMPIEGRVSQERLREAAIDCLRGWRDDDRRGRSALAVVMAREWVVNLGRLQDVLTEPVDAAVETARIPWWR